MLSALRRHARRLRRHAHRLRRADNGVALVEFAISLPLLLATYIGGYVLSDGIACNRKVATATHTLTDLASQCIVITQTGSSTDPCVAGNILGASVQVMSPYPAASSSLRLSEVQVTDATHAKVIWSVGQGGYSAYAVNASLGLPTGMATSVMIPTAQGGTAATGTNFLFGEVGIDYHPAVGWQSMTHFALADQIYMVPRLTSAVPLQ